MSESTASPTTRTASARAAEASQLLVMQPDDFDQLLRRSPETAAFILKNLAIRTCDRLRDLSTEFADDSRMLS